MKTFLFPTLFSVSFIQIIGSDANILIQPHNWAQISAGEPGYPGTETITKGSRALPVKL